ncbi:ribonuclease domain-containing protein [Uliginosibacterium aquaticum]|uniref:Ribonuclease N n=1 Tax=Uliginosibacterium aquaticum TaxID=2731212 RepID=A0ABX2ILV2_9RHOO|nr:ribonuclease domain-containing protein [Uliginosibacterium aquaticum]NSL55283.1 ribonuclease N [Uliginosibacterium aquaticum]
MKFIKHLILVLLALLLSGLQPLAARETLADGSIARIHQSELPPEARDTLRLIERGGPFPYRKDGVVFQNRERRLPAQARAYYREYTVPTPGSRDRGARRIVTGEAREYYYSADHYRSFKRIMQP